MGVLDSFESLMRNIVEGSFGRVFRSRIDEKELPTILIRAMEEHLVEDQGKREAPLLYKLYVNQHDFSYLSRFTRTLAQRLSDVLISVARERGYVLRARPVVLFYEDPSLVTGQPRVETFMSEALSEQQSEITSAPAIDVTRSITPEEAQELARSVPAGDAVDSALPPAWLTLYRPRRAQPIRLRKAVTHLGRQSSNDLVVNDGKASRYHAVIRYEHGQFILYDLSSTNGVGVNGVFTHQPVPLKNNDVIALGSHEFVFQRR